MPRQEVSTLVQRPVTRPNSFIFTLYGDMVHRLAGDGALWIGGLIRLMASFGVLPQAVRQAVSRMTRQGWLVARREGILAFYLGTRPRPPPDRGAQPPHLRASYRVGRSLAAAHLYRRGDAAPSARTPPEGAGRAWLGATLLLDLDPPSDALEAAREAAAATLPPGAVHLFESEYRGPLSDRALLEPSLEC